MPRLSSPQHRFPGTPARHCGIALASISLALCGCGNTAKLPESAMPTPSAVKSGPQLGYAWKSADQTLRPILGVPGSSQIGASVVAPTTFVAAESSSANSIALLIGSDQQVYLMSLPNGTPAKINLAASAGSKIRFSPSGTAALVYVPGSPTASVVTNLASGPQIRLASFGAPVNSIAVSDDGTAVAAVKASSGYALELITSANARQQLEALNGDGGLAFAGTGDDLLAADSASNTLSLIRSVSSSPSMSQIPTSNLLKTPIAVGASRNGRWAVVANSGESSVVQVDLTGAAGPQRIACPSQPTVVEPLAGNGVFRFTDIGPEPAWIADLTAPNPSMFFIPASR